MLYGLVIFLFYDQQILKLEDYEYDVKEGGIAIYNDTALEKFIEYSNTNHRGRKKKETENPEE